jgi:hypothetical protein
MDNQIIAKEENQVNFFNEKRWNGWLTMAETFIKSGALPSTDNISTIMMKIQGGYEMGMKPLEAVKSFYFVKGVMSIFGAATTKRLTEHGWKITYKEEPNKCQATIKKGDESYTDELTFNDAEKSKWTSVGGVLKAGWYEGANRKMKLRYGVLSMLIKTHVPEVLGSAVDIKEIAEDTVPLIQGEETTGFELDGGSIEKIYATKNKDELKKVCRAITDEKGKDYELEVLKFYNLKKTELEMKDKKVEG